MGNEKAIKRIIVIVILAFTLFFWLRSIFSDKNLPGKKVKYSYTAGLTAESVNTKSEDTVKEESENRPPPPEKVSGSKEVNGHVSGEVGKVNIKPPPGKTGKGPQPTPPPVPIKSPPPPPDMREKEKAKKEKVEKKPEPATEALPVVEDKQIAPVPDKVAVSTPAPTKKKKIKALKIPGENDLKTYFDWRLNIQIKYPAKWILTQSTTLPEFSCISRQADNFKLTCRRQKIMEDRKFADEVKTIFRYETTGRAIENVKKHDRKIGKHQLVKYTMDEYELDQNNIKIMKSKFTFLFIEAGDEIAMFFFEVPYEYAEQTTPLVNKMIKSIKVVKRPKPGSAGVKKK